MWWKTLICMWILVCAGLPVLRQGEAYGWEDDEPDWAADAPAAQRPSQPKEGRMALFVNPPEASIYVDGVYQGQGQFVGSVPWGAKQVRFELNGHLTVEEVVTVEEGDGPVYLVVHMRPMQAAGPTYVGRTGGWIEDAGAQIAAWSLTGGGSVFLVSGVVLLAMDGKSSCQGCNGKFETTAAGATLTGIGAAALTAGVTFFLWDQLAGRNPSDGTAPTGSERWTVGVSPSLGEEGASGGQLLLSGRW
jgi:hypothetical protein